MNLIQLSGSGIEFKFQMTSKARTRIKLGILVSIKAPYQPKVEQVCEAAKKYRRKLAFVE